MKAIKIDVEKIEHCVDAYKDEHGKNPYLIMNTKTRELLPPVFSHTGNTTISLGDICISNSNITKPIDLVINGTKYISEDEIKKGSEIWLGCKIMIDNTLELGEVHIG